MQYLKLKHHFQSSDLLCCPFRADICAVLLLRRRCLGCTLFLGLAVGIVECVVVDAQRYRGQVMLTFIQGAKRKMRDRRR